MTATAPFFPPANWLGLERTCLLWYDGPLIELYTDPAQGHAWLSLVADENTFENSARVETIHMVAYLSAEQLKQGQLQEEVPLRALFENSSAVFELCVVAQKNTSNSVLAEPPWLYSWGHCKAVDYAQVSEDLKPTADATLGLNFEFNNH